MITAWLPLSGPRRRSPGAPRRLLLVAMLLFGLVYAHGASTEGVTQHLASPKMAVSAEADAHGAGGETKPVVHEAQADSADANGNHDGDHGSSHPAQECLPGQPQQGPALDAPCLSTLPDETALASGVLPDAVARGERVAAPPSLRDATGSAILRI